MLYLKTIYGSQGGTQSSQELAFEIWAPRFGNIQEFLSGTPESSVFCAASPPLQELKGVILKSRAPATSRATFRDLTSAELELLPELLVLLGGFSSLSRELGLPFSVELGSDKLARVLGLSSVVEARVHEEFFEDFGEVGAENSADGEISRGSAGSWVENRPCRLTSRQASCRCMGADEGVLSSWFGKRRDRSLHLFERAELGRGEQGFAGLAEFPISQARAADQTSECRLAPSRRGGSLARMRSTSRHLEGRG